MRDNRGRAWPGQAGARDPAGSGAGDRGVASGDPRDDGFVIWTRLAPRPLDGGGRARSRGGGRAHHKAARFVEGDVRDDAV